MNYKEKLLQIQLRLAIKWEFFSLAHTLDDPIIRGAMHWIAWFAFLVYLLFPYAEKPLVTFDDYWGFTVAHALLALPGTVVTHVLFEDLFFNPPAPWND